MFDGFWYGIFGGLFGPALAQWLSRFRYWVIFLMTTLAVHCGAFILDWLNADFFSALHRSVSVVFTTAGILAPMGIGLLAVFVAFVGSLSSPKKGPQTDHDVKK